MNRSRHTVAIVAIFLMAAAFRSAIADGFLPTPCEGLFADAGGRIRCPTPYVELVSDRHDDIFARNFLCRESGYVLGVPHGGGCGTSMMDGWSLPPGVSVTVASSEGGVVAEIDAHVVNPCLLVGIRSNPVFSQMDEKAALDLLRKLTPGDVDSMRDSILPLTEGKSLDERMALYARAVEFCTPRMAGEEKTAAARSVAVEGDAIIGSKIRKMEEEDRQALLDELVGYVRAEGWKCDSISAARKHVFSRGFDLSCNGFAYQYAVEDKGGTWIARLD